MSLGSERLAPSMVMGGSRIGPCHSLLSRASGCGPAIGAKEGGLPRGAPSESTIVALQGTCGGFGHLATGTKTWRYQTHRGWPLGDAPHPTHVCVHICTACSSEPLTPHCCLATPCQGPVANHTQAARADNLLLRACSSQQPAWRPLGSPHSDYPLGSPHSLRPGRLPALTAYSVAP
jgi:hypothetical protein